MSNGSEKQESPRPTSYVSYNLIYEPCLPGVSYQVRHKLGCTTTEDGKWLEILDLESKGIVLCLCSQNKGADWLCGYCAADLCLVFAYAKIRFSQITNIAQTLFVCVFLLEFNAPFNNVM